MPFTRAALVALLSFSVTALAHSVSEEIGVGSTPATPTSPHAGYGSDQIVGYVDLSDEWSLRFALGLTHEQPQPAENGAIFPEESASNVLAGSIGADWMPNAHWDFAAEGDFSPASQQYTSATVPLSADGGTASADALIHSVTSSFGGMLAINLSTAGDSAFEGDGSLAAQVTRFDTIQNIPRAEIGDTVYTALQVAAKVCRGAAASAAICSQLKPALRGQPAELTQLRISAAATGILFGDTELTLGGAYYVYDTDPTQVGFFSSLAEGRQLAGGALGNGLPIAPLLYSIRPEISQRLGPVRISAYYQFGQYYGADGYGLTVGGRVQYRFNRNWKIWLTGSWQDDVQPATSATGEPLPATSTLSFAIAAGVRLAW